MDSFIKIENTEIRFHENWPDIDVNLAIAGLNLGRASSEFNFLMERVSAQFDLSVFELEVMVFIKVFFISSSLNTFFFIKCIDSFFRRTNQSFN